MMPLIEVCPSTLSIPHQSYSPEALNVLFDGASVSHILAFDSSKKENKALVLEQRKRISASGVQEKISLRLDNNILRLTQKGEQGTHILKPIPRDLRKVNYVPANEHLTMQIAQQVMGSLRWLMP